jgi:hypothetical protein
MRRIAARAIRLALILAYAWGAAVHVMNMFGLSGFDWVEAPMKWKVLDVGYLVLDLAIVVGLALRRGWALVALGAAATSQILLYTIGREWILSVPPSHAPGADARAYLDVLVAFHVVTLGLIALLAWLERRGLDPRSR